MRAIGILAACVIGLAASSAALAQTPALDVGMPGTEFADLSFFEARVEAYKKRRLLMVYVYDKGVNTSMLEKRTFRNPTLAAFTLWHAVAVKYTTSDAGPVLSCAARKPSARDKGGGYPKVFVFRDLREPTRSNCPEYELGLGTQSTGFGDMQFGLMGDGGGGKIPDFVPTPIYVLLQTDILLECLKSLDPVWSMFHEKLNPEPEPPEPSDPLYQMSGDGADQIVESSFVLSETGDEGGVVVDVMAQLDDAREAVANREWSRAAGLYTWLWERGEYFDPAFRAARRSVVADEMRQLFDKHPGTRGRFTRLRDEVTKRLRWADRPELTEWFILNGVVGDHVETLAYLDLSINDMDEASMLPRAFLDGYNLMMTRDFWNDPWEPAGDPPRPGADPERVRVKPGTGPGESLKRVQKLHRTLSLPRHTLIQRENWPALVEFRKQFFFEEACRLHAACLRAGFETEAWEIADLLLKVRDEGEAKLALVTTAMAAGQERARHLVMLDQATALGHTTPTLRERLVGKLGAGKK